MVLLLCSPLLAPLTMVFFLPERACGFLFCLCSLITHWAALNIEVEVEFLHIEAEIFFEAQPQCCPDFGFEKILLFEILPKPPINSHTKFSKLIPTGIFCGCIFSETCTLSDVITGSWVYWSWGILEYKANISLVGFCGFFPHPQVASCVCLGTEDRKIGKKVRRYQVFWRIWQNKRCAAGDGTIIKRVLLST